MHGRGAAVALSLAAALLMPAVAGAATKTVQAGPFGPAAGQLVGEDQRPFGDANQYFRKTVTIHRGDRVRWKINGFHTVTFVPDGEDPPALVMPDPSTPVSGVSDAAGAAFWFNGQPTLTFNPLAAGKQGGATFDPDELYNSGLPPDEGPPPPYKLRFNRTGTYRYLCIVHPGQAGTVKVVRPNRRIPSARQDRRAAQRELDRAINRVEQLATGNGLTLDKTIQAGNDRRGGATVFRFFPADASYKVGDTVTLQMPPSTSETHTFTFGPTNGKDGYVDQLANGLIGPAGFDPRGTYPSEPPPAGVPAYTGTNHGNGFYNSGFLDGNPNSPLPSSTQVRFTAAGSFAYICLIHPFMTGKVTVTP
jgi:plastocyanin